MVRVPNQPASATAPNKPQAMASPFGWIREVRVKSPPETKGPMLRPAAERVCAIPLRVPRLAYDGAEFVIWLQMMLASKFSAVQIPWKIMG